MFKIFSFLLFINVYLISQVCLSQTEDEYDIPLDRYAEFQMTNKVSQKEIDNILREFMPESGKWKGIDYSDKSRTAWKLVSHLRNILILSQAVAQNRKVSVPENEILKVVNKGLSFWIESDFKNDNWFPNEITVPSMYRGILILLREKDLNPILKSKMLERLSLLKYSGKSSVNLVWMADIVLHYGLLVKDKVIVGQARDAIQDQILIVKDGVGLQSDFSYHFHEERLQMYSYGRGFLSTNSRIAWELSGTEFAFTDEKVNVLCDFALIGWQWLSRGAYTVPSTMDRASTRKGALLEPKQIQVFNFLIEAYPKRKVELLLARNAQIDMSSFKLDGSKNFFKSDILVSHTPNASIFLKTLSDRTLPTQSINSENLKGRFLNSGNTYFVKDGQEYYNLLGNWDWTLLPGFTYVEGASRVNRKVFTGTLEYSNYSVSVMNFELLDDDKGFVYAARKAWFVLDDQVMLALIAPNKEKIEAKTAMDQSRWRGSIEGSFIKSEISTEGHYRATGPFYIYHNGWAYICHSLNQMDLSLEAEDSDWASINERYSKQKESQDRVFKPVLISHGEEVEYAVAPVNNAEDAQFLFDNKTWLVSLNTNEAQVITLQNGVVMAAVYEKNNEIKLNKNIIISANQPILLILEGEKLKITNLNPDIKSVELTINTMHKVVEFDKIEGTVISL